MEKKLASKEAEMKADDLIKKFEKQYEEEKKKEGEELHNRLGGVLDELRPEIQTALYVLDIIKFELLTERYKQLFEGLKPEGPKPGTIKFGKSEERTS